MKIIRRTSTTPRDPGTVGNINLVMEGDSIFQGVTSGGATVGNFVADRLMQESYFAGRTTLFNVATSGETVGNIIDQYPTQVFPRRPAANNGIRTILLLLVGTNGSDSEADQATRANLLLSYCATALADGFEVWLCTLLPRNTGVSNQWSVFNNILRTSTNYTKLIDLNLLFRNANTAWTGDFLHPNNLGYAIIASYINSRAFSPAKHDQVAIGSMGKQDASNVGITGGTITAGFITGTTSIMRTSTGATVAEYGSQALGAGGNRVWTFGHNPNVQGNIPVNGFSLNYFNGTSWEFGLAGFAPNGGVIGNQMRIVPRAVSGLSSLSLTIGNKAIVNDANNPVISSAVASGGTRLCEVTYNGSNWIVTAILN